MSKKQDSGGAVLTVEQLRTRQETHHLSVAASLFALYLLTGSLYFTLNGEALSFVDALYFLIVSFTTVGFVVSNVSLF